MKAAFALITDTATANVVSQTAWRLHLDYRIGIDCRRIPPHVSLKQPFDIQDLAKLEAYMDAFAKSIRPFRIALEIYQLWEVPVIDPVSGVLSIRITETGMLRDLHNRLNQELTERFGQRKADFDGDTYSFHVTVASGGGTIESYRTAYAAVRETIVPASFETQELALFVYDNNDGKSDWQYMTYKTVPLG